MNDQSADWIDGQGPEAPPSANGELLFEAPWEARAFGMVHTLCDAGCFSWDEFRAELIKEIGRWDAQAAAHAADAASYRYYERWLAALAAVLAQKGVTTARSIEVRTTALARRPHGHDHAHH